MNEDELYVCQVCGWEDHPDQFGRYCPNCGADLDEIEGEPVDATVTKA